MAHPGTADCAKPRSRMTRGNRAVGQLLFVVLVLVAFGIVIESGAWLPALGLVVVAWLIATLVDRR